MNNTLFKLSVIASVLLLTACNDSKNERPEINYKPQAINANVITQTEVVITDMLNAYDQNNEPLTFTLVTEPKFGNNFNSVTTVVSMPSFCHPVACGANPVPVPFWP